MRYSAACLVGVAASFASFATAQIAVPECAVDCLAASVKKVTTCANTDVACQCKPENVAAIQNDVLSCLLFACDPKQIPALGLAVNAACAPYMATSTSKTEMPTFTFPSNTNTGIPTNTEAPNPITTTGVYVKTFFTSCTCDQTSTSSQSSSASEPTSTGSEPTNTGSEPTNTGSNPTDGPSPTDGTNPTNGPNPTDGGSNPTNTGSPGPATTVYTVITSYTTICTTDAAGHVKTITRAFTTTVPCTSPTGSGPNGGSGPGTVPVPTGGSSPSSFQSVTVPNGGGNPVPTNGGGKNVNVPEPISSAPNDNSAPSPVGNSNGNSSVVTPGGSVPTQYEAVASTAGAYLWGVIALALGVAVWV